MESEKEEHPSYGAIQISRSSGGDRSLFMSDVPHAHRISLKICEATKERNLNTDRHYTSPQSIIEVDMSEHQFARLMSSVGLGSGVPCTIRRRNGEMIEPPPPVDKTEVYHDELEEAQEDFEEKLNSLEDDVAEILDPDEGGYVGKADKKKVLNKIQSTRREIADSIPHLFNMLRENLEETVEEAKADIHQQAGRMADIVKAKAEGALDSVDDSLMGLLNDEDK